MRSELSLCDSFVLRLPLIRCRIGAGYATFVTHTDVKSERSKRCDMKFEFSTCDSFVCCEAKSRKCWRVVANILLCGVCQVCGMV